MPKQSLNKPEENPVVETYRGIEIRRYPTVRFRVDIATMKEIIDARIDTGLSDRQTLGHSSTPCEHCKNIKVSVFNDNDIKVDIKRGLLSKRIPKN